MGRPRAAARRAARASRLSTSRDSADDDASVGGVNDTPGADAGAVTVDDGVDDPPEVRVDDADGVGVDDADGDDDDDAVDADTDDECRKL